MTHDGYDDDVAELAADPWGWVLTNPTLLAGVEQNLRHQRLRVQRAQVGADLAARVNHAGTEPRVVVRCPDRSCGRTVAGVYDTDQGPLYVATIAGAPADRRGPSVAPWEARRRLMALPDETLDDDARLFEATHGTRVFKNPPVMPYDTPAEVVDTTVTVLLDPPFSELWCRCSQHHHPLAHTVDHDELLNTYQDATRANRFRRTFRGTVRPLV